MGTKRKLQISNGHYLQFDQLARILHAINSRPRDKIVKMSSLEEDTGLPFRQVRNRISIARAMGIINKKVLQHTPLGSLISTYDPFFEMKGTLEYLHYLAAGNYYNIIWFEVFNNLLQQEPPMKYKGWTNYFQKSLSNEYSEFSLKDHMPKELRFIINAYSEKNFKKLEILYQDSQGFLSLRRYSRFYPLILSAMIYDFCSKKETLLFQIEEMVTDLGSPARVFGLDAAMLRQQIEGLHDRGWLRYETTHNLDQVRLKSGFWAMEFLTAHFEDRDPREDTKPSPGGIFQ
ncbi:MAG: DUF4007 family protein [Planctomycetota bacterium]